MPELRLSPSSPQYARYDELQRTLCTALNWHMHPILRRVDPLIWQSYHLPRLEAAIKAEMSLMIEGGLDD